jgi:phosphoserine aminotransferase
MNNKIYFTPGPSELYPTVRQHMMTALDEKVGAISHRSKQFQEIYKTASDNLKTLLNLPSNYEILFLSSATEIWERIIENCVEKKSFHCVNGSFSKRFYEFAGELGREAYKEEVAFGKGFYPASITVPADAEIICLTHNETSSGVSMPVEDINTFRDKNKDALIFVDAVSSLPYPNFDWTKIDSVFFSVQKCFGLPAGLGVWILNDKVIAKSKALLAKGRSIGTYHSIPSLLEKALVNQTPETPNAMNIFLLGKVTQDMLQIGADGIRKQTEAKAALVNAYIESSKVFSFGVEDARLRSMTTIVANTTILPGEINKILEPFDMAIGAGYGPKKDTQIRIANFPAHSIEHIQKLVKILQEKIG